MISFPNCKINLGLHVTEKRTDGFHNIETVFYPVQLYDILEIIKSDKGNSFESSGIDIPGNISSNLVLCAYELLKKDFDLSPVQVYLHKIIPIGAGLGGGSSDAAFAIKILNELFFLKISDVEMMHYASRLGSDCAFFIENKPVFACGKGDEFTNIKIDLSGYIICLVKPDISVNTAEAYSLIKPDKKKISIEEIVRMPIEQWKDVLINDFEKPVFKKYPQIKIIKEKMYESGAFYASMSGSGSAVYGIFEKEVSLKNNFAEDYFVWEGKL